jgi:hypothetical protein
MQRKTWKQAVRRTGGCIALLAITPLTLATLLPGAWMSVSEASPSIDRGSSAAKTWSEPAHGGDDVAILDQWSDTSFADLTPDQKRTLAKHEALESYYLKRAQKLDRYYTLKFIQRSPPAQRHRILTALNLYQRQERQLLRLHWNIERQSGTPFTITFPHFRP